MSSEEIPGDASHFAIGAPYAHVTAPLRRVCDRYANEILLAVEVGRPAPDWATETLVSLPAVMGRARQRERAFEKAVLDLVEVLVLESNPGQQFEATVVDVRSDRSVVALSEPAIVAELDAVLDLGSRIRVELTGVERAERRLTFRVVPHSSTEPTS